MKHHLLAVVAVAASGHSAISDPVPVSLSDYAFDFPSFGYEIEVTGETSNTISQLVADDHINIREGAYSLKTLINRLSRNDRKGFTSYFNDHCVGFFTECSITAAGEVEVDESMQMIFIMHSATISSHDSSWTNARSE